jgi:hypothetical protein
MTKRQVEYICLTAAAVGLSALITGMAAAEDPQAMMAAYQQASKETRMRIVGRWEGDDKLVEEFYEKKAGKEMKTMEITYTRAK